MLQHMLQTVSETVVRVHAWRCTAYARTLRACARAWKGLLTPPTPLFITQRQHRFLPRNCFHIDQHRIKWEWIILRISETTYSEHDSIRPCDYVSNQLHNPASRLFRKAVWRTSVLLLLNTI